MAAKIAAKEIEKVLRNAADAKRAEGMTRFFKSGPGGYAEGDKFLGINNPGVRAIVRQFRGAPVSAALSMLKSEWHEVRLCGGLLLVDAFERSKDEGFRRGVFEEYLRNARRFNNWDLVDLTSPNIVGGYLLNHKDSRKILRELAKSECLWEQRIAMVSTLKLVRAGQYGDAFCLAKSFFAHPHDLMHKATGWVLREIGKRDRAVLDAFLALHAPAMPRTALRYAIERHPAALRASILRSSRAR